MTTFEKLALKIKNETGVVMEDFKRAYPGLWCEMKWHARTKSADVESRFSASYLLKGDIEIYKTDPGIITVAPVNRQ